MPLAEQDIAALHRVLDAITQDPALEQSSELAPLRKWARQHGAHFPHGPAAEHKESAHGGNVEPRAPSAKGEHGATPSPPEEQDQFYGAAATKPPPPPHPHSTTATGNDPSVKGHASEAASHEHSQGHAAEHEGDVKKEKSYPSAQEHAAPHEQLHQHESTGSRKEASHAHKGEGEEGAAKKDAEQERESRMHAEDYHHQQQHHKEEREDDEKSEPDPERWTLEDGAESTPEEIPNRDEEPKEEDLEKAMALKAEAAELDGSGKHDEALAKLTEALKLTPRNAMYWGLRALYNLRQKKLKAALHDADRALSINPQNVRALRVRGTVRRHLGEWEAALKDLSEAQAVDYDEETHATMRFVQSRVSARHQRHIRQQEREEKERQESAKRRRQEEEERHAQHQPRGAPFGGMPGGFPGGMPGGMPGMEALFSDPDLLAALQDPEIAGKLTQAMQNPASIIGLMQDPKIGPILTKVFSKVGGGAPGGPRTTPPPHQPSAEAAPQHAAASSSGSAAETHHDPHGHPSSSPPKPSSGHPANDLD